MIVKQTAVWTLIALTAALAAADEDYLSSAALHEAGLAKYWQLGLPLEKDQHLTNAYRVDDQLYLATQDGYVFAVHARTGVVRWLKQITRSGHRLRRPVHAGGQTIFVTPTSALQLDRLYGDGLARTDLRFPTGSAPASDGVRFFIGGINGRIYAYALYDQLQEWKAATSGPIRARPALFNNVLYLASDDGGVYACTAARKKFIWSSGTLGANTADLTADERGVYVPSQDHSLYLFSHQTGQIRWRARFAGPLYEAAIVTPELVYQFCADDGLVAVEAQPLAVEERIRWKLPRGRALLTIHEGRAFVLSQDETLLAVDVKDGGVKHTIPAAGFTLPMPAAADATVYVASPDGRIFCARPKGAPPVSQEEIRRALLPRRDTAETRAATDPPARAAERRIPDYLETRNLGRPIGGKSKVTRQLLEQEKPGGTP